MSKCNRPKNMTVIVRVAGWLAPSLFGFHVHKTQQFVNSVQEKAKFSQHYCPQLSPPTIWFLSTFPEAYKGLCSQCIIMCRVWGPGGGVWEGGWGGGGFPSVVRTPSVPHFQLPIFIFQKFLCFLHFLCFLCTQGT